jgi:5'-deoxynucleotidase YfbR-like HD superfamily hydrolase
VRDLIKNPWIETYSGRVVDLLDPNPDDIVIEDIAHALSNICRFGGHSRVFYSVSQHSVLVSQGLPDTMKLAGLMHDSAESYLSDIPRPLKLYLNGKYGDLEKKYMGIISRKFRFQEIEPEEVHIADQAVLLAERRDLFNWTGEDWGICVKPFEGKIIPLSPWLAEHRFLGVFRVLYTEVA